MQFNVLLSFNWNTLLSLVLFFIALGVLVTIHEFGHFIAAKSFKVYCTDFSIGFGPKIVKIKREKWETTFSIGVLPLGGYVSMLGEDDEESVPEGIVVPKERTLIGVARYKRVIIMSAGIIMNFVLAYLIFFISASCFPQIMANSWYEVGENPGIVSLVSETSFTDNDQLVPANFYYRDGTFYAAGDENLSKPTESEALHILNEGSFTIEGDESGKKYIASLSYSLAGGVNNTDISKNIFLYETSGEPIVEGSKYCAPSFNENGEPIRYTHSSETSGNKFKFKAYFANATSDIKITNPDQSIEYEREDDANKTLKLFPCEISLESDGSAFLPLNVSFYKYEYWYGWQSFAVAGEDWAQSTTLIAQALGSLFIGQGWDQLGGPLAIFSQTTDILQNNPFYAYLNTWGTISVNLALFNLLPFPGLDGWQILVEIVEGSVNGVRKAKYKASQKIKEEKINDKPLELTENAKENELAVDAVTTNKDVNLTIGKKDKTEKGFVEWEIPTKFKTIMSFVGLGLLMLLMIVVLVKDIFMVF